MTIATINPATGETVQEFAAYDAATVDRRIGEADDIARILTLEMGKPIAQAKAEALKCAKGTRFYAEHAKGFLADEPLKDPSSVGASKAWVTYQPLGALLAVMSWNYPLWQVIRFAAPALMAGNSGVLKHTSNVPQAALYLDTLFERGGFPVGSFRTLLIGSEEVEAVIRDPRIQAVTLTGSEAAGRSIASIAGSELKKSIMELGGSDPFIVMPSADLEAAATTAIKARVQNNGQSCIAAKRFLVHADVYDAFVRLFVDKMKALTIGNPFDETVDVGPIATKSGRSDLVDLVGDAIDRGATILTGGKAVDGPGWFYEPTVVADLTDDMRIVTQEAFGPVASLYKVADRDHAVQIANQTAFGLSSAVWTTNSDDEAFFVRELLASAVFINGMTPPTPNSHSAVSRTPASVASSPEKASASSRIPKPSGGSSRPLARPRLNGRTLALTTPVATHIAALAWVAAHQAHGATVHTLRTLFEAVEAARRR